MTNQEIVLRLGEPDRKGGPPTIPVWISYESRGIQFEFKTKSWEDKQNPIEIIVLFSPK
jgi:frataxin-like iron-binding protein CyaY